MEPPVDSSSSHVNEDAESMEPLEANEESGYTSSAYSSYEDDDEMEESDDETGEDRLSELPDPILHHILSFLDTKLAIPTAILAKRWRYLWKSLPFLSFDRDDFKAIEAFSPVRRDFVHFVNQVLSKRNSNSSIHSFRLYWGNGFCRQTHIDSWLCHAISRNVQQLDIQISTKDRLLELPSSLYTSRSLQSLELDFCQGYKSEPTCIPLPESVDIPLLKNLSLQSADYIGSEFLNMYFSGCPVLEKLTLIGCCFEGDENLVFSAPQLKYLNLGIFDKDACFKNNPEILISAPNLISFTCTDYVSHHYSFENLSKLEVASMEMESPENDYYYEQEGDGPAFTKEDTNRMIKCLKELYNVKSLTVNSTFLEVISVADEVLTRSFIPFSNLRYLKLVTWIDEAQLRSIAYLLENSPNVETLVFDFLVTGETVNIEEYWGELSVLNVKSMEVWNFQGRYDHDLDFLKSVLKHAVGLEKLTVFKKQGSKLSEESMKCFQKKLLTCPHASPGIIIEFREPEEIDEDSYESSLAVLSFLLADRNF